MKHKGCIRYYDENDKLHRIDGPAVDNNIGKEKEYYIHGIRIKEDGYKLYDRVRKINTLLGKPYPELDVEKNKYHDYDDLDDYFDDL